MFPQRTPIILLKKQQHTQGSALMMALFVIIIMSLLGAALIKMQSTSSETIAQEVLGTRALAAARSGMQAQLQQLFPLKPNVGSCPAVEVSYDLSTIAGLKHCRAQVNCQRYAENDGVQFYRLTSTGQCGSGEITSNSQNVVLSSRTVQVEAKTL